MNSLVHDNAGLAIVLLILLREEANAFYKLVS
jgi:hypothetical protein